MKVLILHLSDIHFSKRKVSVFDKIDGIRGVVESLCSEHSDVTKCFVLVTGDIADKGYKSQYDIAFNFFNLLRSQLKAINTNIEITYIITPGNHDCVFRKVEKNRDSIIRRILIEEGSVEESEINELIEAQNNFFDFLSKITPIPFSQDISKLFWKIIIPVDEYKIAFYCLNTSYISQEHEKQGEIAFPVKLLADPEKYDLACALFHHPYNWFKSSNKLVFKNQIEKMADVIYTGHEHDSDIYDIKKASGETTEYLEGDRLQTLQNNESGFNCEIYDFLHTVRKRYQYKWRDNIYIPVIDPKWQEYNRKEILMEDYINNPAYLKELTDIGTGFSHPRKDNLLFDDIFVIPELLEIKFQENKSANPLQRISSDKLIDYVLNNKHLMILGPELSGKSLLAKGLYKIFQNEHYVPILIDGTEIITSIPDKINQIIYNAFTYQYSDKMLYGFKQLPKSQKVLIIDSFDRSTTLNSKGKHDFINHVQNVFDHIIILGTEIIEIEDILSIEQSSTISFRTCELSEFYPSKRIELIERWIKLGQQYEISDKEFKYKIKTYENGVNLILQEKLLPPYPFVILTILQTIDASIPLETSSGAYGHLFQLVITKSIARSSINVQDLRLKYNYLSVVANYMFTRKISKINDDDIRDIDNIFYEKHDIWPRGKNLLDELSRVPVIRNENSNYSFKYPYLFHFFVARYMHQNLRDPKETEQIKVNMSLMIKNAYKHEYTSIITFLCHFSADPLVYDSILENARAIFKEHQPCDLEKDVLFLKLPTQPKIKVINNDPNEARKDILDKQDLVEMKNQKKEQLVDIEDVNDIESLNLVNKVTLALRTVYILGQILRNFSTDLTKETKMALAEECYFCGLRTLKDFYNFFENNIDDIKKEFFETFKEEHETDAKHIIMERVEDKIFYYSMIMALGMIKKISYSVGEESLKETYKKVLAKCNTTAVKLIDISIKLDHFRNIPKDEIKSVYKIVNNNPLPTIVLQLLVIQNALKYRWDYKARESIFALIEIKTEDPKFLLAPPGKYTKPKE